MIYIEAFGNMKIDNVLDFLEPIITDHDRSRHIRLVAIWAAKSATVRHPGKVNPGIRQYRRFFLICRRIESLTERRPRTIELFANLS